MIIVGGSREYVGAPTFAAGGAIAGGADLVYLFVPKCTVAAARKFSPNVIVRECAGDPDRLTSAAIPDVIALANKPHTALVVGPGLGRDAATCVAIKLLITQTRTPLVLDADALQSTIIESATKRIRRDSKSKIRNSELDIVLTPHAGEFRRMFGHAPTAATIRAAAQKFQTTILAKGRHDTIASPDGEMMLNRTGHPILTVGGTGDTLAGLVGAFLARGVREFEAAACAAYLVGRAGETLAAYYESVMPQLVAREIPRLLRRLIGEK